jgi:hypothetical protein
MAEALNGNDSIQAWAPVNQFACLSVETPYGQEFEAANLAPGQVTDAQGVDVMTWKPQSLDQAVTVVTRKVNAESQGNTLLAIGGLISGLGLGILPFGYIQAARAISAAWRSRRP